MSDLYSQINYQDKPVRVSPLVYASPIKWLTNQADGIPAVSYTHLDVYKRQYIYSALVEAYSSEQNARMNAMRSATESADDMIRSLRISCNPVSYTHLLP